MKQLWKFRLIYWTSALVLVTGIFTSFTPDAGSAFMLATLALPAALFGSWAMFEIIRCKKPWYYWIYALIGVLWLSYSGAIAGYWFLFELDPNKFPSVLINPFFTLFWTGALAFGQWSYERKRMTNLVKEVFVEFTSERKSVRVALDKVRYVESRNTFTIVHVEAMQYPSSKAIKHWEEDLDQFVRIHRSLLVNPAFVASCSQSAVTLNNGEKLPLSRTYKEAALSVFAV